MKDITPRKHKPSIVCSAVIKKDDKYLVIFDPLFSEWRVPGGRLELNETVEQGLKREIQQELGLNIEVNTFLGFGQDSNQLNGIPLSRVVLYFLCGAETEDLKNLKLDPDEVAGLRWMTMDEIKKEPKLENAMKDFFKRF
jgi:ADP-ribose pyrophosphatase YjhB (NUDIX family)